ncbi:protein shisa-5-like isoform X1 [Lucilia sericata]|uniref:protein shisa-5-like isoform X1 n=1 Tax=Lucilia sericata TaxID=13632 RepID=UPI0018A87724|nr:protein shisa-5-like isoform X1 [Lucilia sericata]XP_037826072.1 protein shisa-5-like isoform X1 [Lucilia sericata]
MDMHMDDGLPTGAIISIVFGALIATAIVVFWIILIVWCCLKRKNVYNQTTVSHSTPVVVTSATHTAPGGYPVTQMPVGATTTAYPSQAYAAPYPPQGAPTQMPMPMPMPAGQPPVGMQPHLPPYPATNMNPPPYDVAVNCAGAGQVNNTGYQKQAPYNPNYPM